MALFDENGSEVDGAMTSEEIEELIDDKKEEIETSNQEAINELTETHQQALEDLQVKIEEKEEELEKEQNKEKNFGNLRSKTKEKDEAISKLQGEIQEMKTNFDTKFSEAKIGEIQEKIDGQVSKLVGANKELKEKVNLYLQSFKVPENAEEALKQVDNAFILASDDKGQNIINSKIVSAAGGVDVLKKSKVSPEAKEFGKKFGITDQDYEKYSH